MSTEAHEPVTSNCGDLASYWKAAHDRVVAQNWGLSRQIGALQKVGEQCLHAKQTTVREAAEAVTKGFSALEVLLAAQDADIPDAEPLWVKVSGRREEIGTYGQLRALRRALNFAHPQQTPAGEGKAIENLRHILTGVNNMLGGNATVESPEDHVTWIASCLQGLKSRVEHALSAALAHPQQGGEREVAALDRTDAVARTIMGQTTALYALTNAIIAEHIEPLRIENETLRAEVARLTDIALGDDAKAIAEYEWERANKLVAERDAAIARAEEAGKATDRVRQAMLAKFDTATRLADERYHQLRSAEAERLDRADPVAPTSPSKSSGEEA